MKTPLLPGEQPVKDGAASLQLGIDVSGGWLYLTNMRLVFESHAFNLQTGTAIIPLKSVSSTRLCWTKWFGLFPLFPNSLVVSTNEGRDYQFIVFGRRLWKNVVDWHVAAFGK
jgi:hypothetical protein